ncbi:MAG: hypothetical protein DI568_04310 [Sphingomonas sp.]|nr:MAG: hypothetical protein DI568_04310 [Sphingomonas sp.]
MTANSAFTARDYTAPKAPLWVPVLIFLLMLVPLALTPLIPAVDFNDHLLRYWILADNGATPELAANYSPRWALLSNLGMDVLGTGLLKLLPPMTAGKILAAMVLFAPFAGALYLAHAVHGRLTLFTVLLGAFLGFSHIFTWGFANFLLGLGMLLFGLGWWIRMHGRPVLQLGGAILLGLVLIFVHALAFGLWGLLLGCVELALLFGNGFPSLKSLLLSGVRLVSIAVGPVLIFLSSRTAEAPQGVTEAVSNAGAYAARGGLTDRLIEEGLKRLDLMLRIADSINPWADRAVGLLLWGLLAVGLVAGALRLAPVLRLAAALALVLVAVMPPNMFGSGYTNDRMPLLLLALLVGGLAINGAHRLARPLTLGIAALLAVHFALVVSSYVKAGSVFRDYMAQTATIELGVTASPLHLGGAGRAENLPFCSALMPALTFTRLVAVPTFANPSQQPLALDGPLQTAVSARAKGAPRKDRAKQAETTDVSTRQERIAQTLSFGFDSVVACDDAGPVPDTDLITRVATGPFWAIYRAKAPTEETVGTEAPTTNE